MSLSKFSSAKKGMNIVISKEGQIATWKSNKKWYVINENAILDESEMTLEVTGKHYTKIVVGFTGTNPNSKNIQRISPRGKMYVGVQRATRTVKIKRSNNYVYMELNKTVKKKKRCTAKEIWIVVGLCYGNGYVTLLSGDNKSEPLKTWKALEGNAEQFGQGCRLKDWNSESYVHVSVPISGGVGMVINICPIKKDRDHFINMNKLNTTTSFENKTRGVLSVCDHILTVDTETDLKIDVQSNGEILFLYGNKRGSTTAETECIRNNNFALVFELFNMRLKIIESYNVDEIENGLAVQPGALVNGSCMESDTPSSLESIMDCDDDEDDENDNQIIQLKSRHHSKSCDVLSAKSENRLEADDACKVDAKQQQAGKGVCRSQQDKDFITSLNTKLLEHLEPYPFCDYLVQHGFMSMEESHYIMRIRDNKPRRDVIREILVMVNKSNITKEEFKSILKKSDFPYPL